MAKTHIELFGGIGNQLFQYAAGRYLEERHEKQCVYSTWRIGFGVQLPFLERNPLESVFAKPAKQFERVLSRFSILRKIEIKLCNIYQSNHVGWDPTLEHGTSSDRLRGYFQSYRYADSLTAADKKLIRGLEKHSNWFQNYSIELQKMGSVAIHIRRGDYLQNPDFGTLRLSYYHEALSVFERDMKIENVFVFSDDATVAQKFCREFKGNAQLVIQDPTTTDYESLILMSQAKAIVIANSTYSWWGAFLSEKGTQVIAPSKWFKNLEDPRDLIPQDWQQIDSIWEEKTNA